MVLFKDVYNFECEIFEPKTANKSLPELQKMLSKLYEYYPKTISSEDGSKTPYDTDNDYSAKWFN